MSTKLKWIEKELQALKEAGLYNRIRTLSSPQGAWLVVDGKRVLNFCSNNYLGLANHPRLVQAAQAGHGAATASARPRCARSPGRWTCTWSWSSAWQLSRAWSRPSPSNPASTPTWPPSRPWWARMTPSSPMSSTTPASSTAAGSRAAKIIRYAHCDPADLERVLKENRAAYPKAMVITDGVFSMDGDIAPLDKIYEVIQNYDAILMVDDAHGEGVLGSGGRGIVDHFDLHGKVDVEIGTLSKAFGVVGGVVAGNPLVVEWLRQRGRPVPVLLRHDRPRCGRLPGRAGSAGRIDRAGGPAVGKRPLLQSRDEAPGL